MDFFSPPCSFTLPTIPEDQPLEALAEALDARRAQLGPAHPDTLTSANNLASCLIMRGRLHEAEPLLVEASRGAKKALGALIVIEHGHRDRGRADEYGAMCAPCCAPRRPLGQGRAAMSGRTANGNRHP